MLRESQNVKIDEDIPEAVRNASKAQLQSLIDEIEKDIAEYEKLQTISLEDIPIQSIQDLLIAPIRYRIVSHMSVDAFSRKVEVNARQIHRYESECYSNVNASTLTKILEKLDLKLDGRIAVP